ncbi:hypothetical protein HNY73_012402 [Argiope bruennichi]|uniref:Ig-like domain-containing protein n=2 Tax=Argiope bruennichi TaxID=94029 RepID=A0A8T0EZ94_ARGBR|nr:hypothetical protein HNY73_012402 [Argiope bruennichi]
MNCLRSLDVIWAILFFFAFVQTSRSCWGPGSLQYGYTTSDYDLNVGSDLIVDCILESGILPNINVSVNSSYLIFQRDSNHQIFSSYTHQIDKLTSQLRIPNANVSDSGLYHCQIVFPDNSKHLVCSTKVFVGYPPKNVSNFKCISRNFDNLTCTWEIESSYIKTTYTLTVNLLSDDISMHCPEPNNDTFCQWTEDTNPPYFTMIRNLTFVINGNNSLGTIENIFKFDHFAIVIPN